MISAYNWLKTIFSFQKPTFRNCCEMIPYFKLIICNQNERIPSYHFAKKTEFRIFNNSWLMSSSIWTCRILKICFYFLPLRLHAENNNIYSIFKTSKSISYRGHNPMMSWLILINKKILNKQESFCLVEKFVKIRNWRLKIRETMWWTVHKKTKIIP